MADNPSRIIHTLESHCARSEERLRQEGVARREAEEEIATESCEMRKKKIAGVT